VAYPIRSRAWRGTGGACSLLLGRHREAAQAYKLALVAGWHTQRFREAPCAKGIGARP
jgi:hypothetical protein